MNDEQESKNKTDHDWIKYKSILFPTNHSKYVIFIISTFVRDMKIGLTFVQKMYPKSFYIKPETLEQQDFTDETIMVQHHDELFNKYLRLVNEVLSDEKSKKENNESRNGRESSGRESTKSKRGRKASQSLEATTRKSKQ